MIRRTLCEVTYVQLIIQHNSTTLSCFIFAEMMMVVVTLGPTSLPARTSGSKLISPPLTIFRHCPFPPGFEHSTGQRQYQSHKSKMTTLMTTAKVPSGEVREDL